MDSTLRPNGCQRRLPPVSSQVVREFRTVNGLVLPYLLETRVREENAPGMKTPQTITEKIVIEKVVVNPKLDDALFSKPQIEAAANIKQSPAAGGHSLQ